MNYEEIALWSQVVSSFAFLIILIWAFRRFMIPAIVKQQEHKNAEIATIEKRRDEAKGQIQQAHELLAQAASDAAQIRTRLRTEAERERERLLAEAREQGERSVRNARGELERARQAGRDKLRIEMIEKALQLARSRADAAIDEAANAKLIDRFVGTLERERIGADGG